MIIPWQTLNPDTLVNLVESFILRDGTDYGVEEHSLVQKREKLLSQIKQGKACIFWSELHQTFDIKPNTHL